MMDSIDIFLAKPDLLDPNNYPDSSVAEQIAIARQQLAELTDEMKTYYSRKSYGDQVAQFIDRALGGFFVSSSPNSRYSSEPKTLSKYLQILVSIDSDQLKSNQLKLIQIHSN